MTTQRKSPSRLAAHLGEQARRARERARLTQEDVAERVDLATEVYGRMERGQCLPSVPTVYRLCRALSVDANVLLGLDATTAAGEPLVPAREMESLQRRKAIRALRQLDSPLLAIVVELAHYLETSTDAAAGRYAQSALAKEADRGPLEPPPDKE